MTYRKTRDAEAIGVKRETASETHIRPRRDTEGVPGGFGGFSPKMRQHPCVFSFLFFFFLLFQGVWGILPQGYAISIATKQSRVSDDPDFWEPWKNRKRDRLAQRKSEARGNRVGGENAASQHPWGEKERSTAIVWREMADGAE